MWIVIVSCIVLVVILLVRKDYKDNIKMNITNHGGMMNKYGKLVEYFKAGGLTLQKLSADEIVFSSNSMVWTLDYIGNRLEVRLRGNMPLVGSISNKWAFSDGYPQEKMIEEFDNYLTWQLGRIGKISQDIQNIT